MESPLKVGARVRLAFGAKAVADLERIARPRVSKQGEERAVVLRYTGARHKKTDTVLILG